MKIVSYDPCWVLQFEQEAKLIKHALGSNCLVVHHIGSTSVPGLMAKPVIDILPVVKKLDNFDHLKELGYLAKGENGMPFRRFFQKESYHVHIFEEGNPEIQRHLKFCEWLRLHKEDALAYGNLKSKLAAQLGRDPSHYSLEKESFIVSIDNKSGYAGQRMVIAKSKREKKAALLLRKQYFLTETTEIQEDANDFHFVYYDKTEIIGYAHIQFLPKKQAILRVLIIDESFRYLGLGRSFLMLCEKWLAQQGIENLFLYSTKEASGFYFKLDYLRMHFNDPDGPAKQDAIELVKHLQAQKMSQKSQFSS